MVIGEDEIFIRVEVNNIPAGGDLLGSGDLARAVRSRSYGDLDLLLHTKSVEHFGNRNVLRTLGVT